LDLSVRCAAGPFRLAGFAGDPPSPRCVLGRTRAAGLVLPRLRSRRGRWRAASSSR